MLLHDADLGDILLISNIRAKKVIARYREGVFNVTHPASMNLPKIKSTIEKMKPRLLDLKEKFIPKEILSPDKELNTISFRITIKESQYFNYYAKLINNELTILCPHETDFTDNNTQNYIRSIIEKHLRIEAKRILPLKLRSFADKHNFDYKSIKINKSISRWGSCSSQKNINFSFRCLLLPEHLADYIILHELCHTIEMNHGERFWNLLDKVTDGKSKELDKELKNFKSFY